MTLKLNKKLLPFAFATTTYVVIAFLIIIPILRHNEVANAVNAQLNKKIHQLDTPKTTVPLYSGAPQTVSIPRLGINIPVAPGFYNFASQTWTLNSNHIFTDNFLNPNPIISSRQTKVFVLYGHDIPQILAKTSGLVHGDILNINTTNGLQFSYYFDYYKVISPTDATILNQPNTGDPIALITCTGLWYQDRRVMFFHLLNVAPMNKVATL